MTVTEDDLDDRRRAYRPAWRCERCGAVHDELPEQCPECGHEAFAAIERWAG